MTGRLTVVLSHVVAWPEVTRGAERYVHELGSALQARGHTVRILTTSEQPRRDEVLGVPLRGFARGPLSGRIRARAQARFGVQCLAQVLPRQVDVWHAGSLYDAAAAAVAGALRPSLRTVLTLHGPVEQRVLSTTPNRQALRLASRVDELVCVSDAAAQQARQAAGLKGTVIPPGVDASNFTPGGARGARPVLLYVGALTTPRKNLSLLLEAAALVPDLEVQLAGPGDASRWVSAAPAAVRDRVRHLGVLHGDALVAAYRRAWVTALISEREVFGMAVVESLACGTPAVVLDDGWGPSAIVGDGTGVRAEATPEGVAAALREALQLTRDPATVERCRAAGSAYDWQTKVVPRLEEVYRRG
ncbi:MAG: phosphatidyl-myo-inositol dimannoside synthase [Streptomyces sp.]|nr:phosphatidyl-myo-inositol dimannoside synthase [Streptomyces sp.]